MQFKADKFNYVGIFIIVFRNVEKKNFREAKFLQIRFYASTRRLGNAHNVPTQLNHSDTVQKQRSSHLKNCFKRKPLYQLNNNSIAGDGTCH